MSETTAQIIERVGLIPVLRAKNAAQAHAVVKAMIAGGVTVVEVTMTVPGAIDLLKELKAEYGDKLLLGSGTVTTAEQAEATIDAGAEFVVSPSLHPAVIAMTKPRKASSPFPARSPPLRSSPPGTPAPTT
jgi:2-dehydro-3-deoxyphosphogluconate aldolase/(4S)-4-hydroxy-2-oxoglutarate aldolase